MRHIKVFESFQEKDIDSICDRFGIINWNINDDGGVDVDGQVYLSDRRLTKLPLKFGKVTGDFYCRDNSLTTLEGAPSYVGGNFACYRNQLTTLEGAPKEVGSIFDCSYNKLTTLEGGPTEFSGDFNCENNKLITLEGAPKGVDHFNCEGNPIWLVYKLFPNHMSYIDSQDYGYLRGDCIVRLRFQEALDELGIEMPDRIGGYKYI